MFKLTLRLLLLSVLVTFGTSVAVPPPFAPECPIVDGINLCDGDLDGWSSGGGGCPSFTGSQTYTCHVELTDPYGRPAALEEVRLQVIWGCPVNWGLGVIQSGVTGPDGRTSISVQAPSNAAMFCGTLGPHAVGVTSPIASGNEIYLQSAIARPNVVKHGLGGGSNGRLILSGDYDYPVIFSPPFGMESWFEYYLGVKEVVDALHAAGVDVWFFDPAYTTRDVHDQAGDLARLIDHAAYRHDGTGAQNQVVAIAGHSTGGLVSRIASARWDDPGESTWRADNGLTGSEPPISLLALSETPNQGVNVAIEVLELLYALELAVPNWEWLPDGFVQPSFDTCAFRQMVQESCMQQPYGFCTTLMSETFYRDGGSFSFYASSLSDIKHCAGGPAVDTINGDGYPHNTRIIALSNGQVGRHNTCYRLGNGPAHERDLSIEDVDVCRDNDGSRWTNNNGEIVAGDLILETTPLGIPFIDAFTKGWDVVPGSRGQQDLGAELPGDGVVNSSYTFLPITSALDIRTCNHFTPHNGLHPEGHSECNRDVDLVSIGVPHPQLDAFCTNTFVGLHDAIPVECEATGSPRSVSGISGGEFLVTEILGALLAPNNAPAEGAAPF